MPVAGLDYERSLADMWHAFRAARESGVGQPIFIGQFTDASGLSYLSF
jgi:hypothetical protein